MKADKQIYTLLTSSPEAFRFLTGGLEWPAGYRGRSVTFKELERRADYVVEPASGEGPRYILEIQAQRAGDVYDRLVLELALYRKAHPGRAVYGLIIFLDASCDEPASPWRECLGSGPLLRPVYLDTVLADASRHQPDHPLLAVFLPLRASDAELADRAPTAWRQLSALDQPEATALLDVFMSWLMERRKGQTYEEIMTMLHVLTPLEETRAYQQLVGIGEQKGRQEGERVLLSRQLRRRFGELPAWAVARLQNADAGQLETWAERIFDVGDLAELLGPESD